jgi:hypothetical protein
VEVRDKDERVLGDMVEALASRHQKGKAEQKSEGSTGQKGGKMEEMAGPAMSHFPIPL